jgi:hypothetical protein
MSLDAYFASHGSEEGRNATSEWGEVKTPHHVVRARGDPNRRFVQTPDKVHAGPQRHPCPQIDAIDVITEAVVREVNLRSTEKKTGGKSK